MATLKATSRKGLSRQKDGRGEVEEEAVHSEKDSEEANKVRWQTNASEGV